jgi:aryl-alcohol dehydrogenase-like predicted oxidoreductase
MNSSPFTDLRLSTLMLGTAQFGLPYGVANRKGQPSYREVLEILACAHEGGVNSLDTAATYGNSEEVLGKALNELGLTGQMTIVTKVRYMADHLSVAAADAIVEESVSGSLRRLGLESLPICLFHREENFCYAESLLKLRERGLVQHIGCSVLTPSGTAPILDSQQAEALQIPANLFDHRFRRAQAFNEAARQGTAVFVRSAFLQGLLLMPEADIPPDLARVVPLRHSLESLAHEAGMTMRELAARYVLGLQGLTSVVVGVESIAQMQDNLALFSAGALPTTLMRQVEETVPVLSDKILLPNQWSTRVPDIAPATSVPPSPPNLSAA